MWDIYEDSVGNIWLACYGGRIWKLSSADGYAPVEAASSPVSAYVSVSELSDGRIAFCSETDGIVCVNPSTLACERVTSGLDLPDNTVYALLQDDDGSVWFSTNYGLCRTDLGFSQITVYTIDDGLPANRFNYNSSEKHGGKLYFGSTNGLVVVDPGLEMKTPSGRRILFNDLFVNNVRQRVGGGGPFGRDLNGLDCLELEHWQNTFSIDFTDNMFGCGGIRTFAYRMQGIDDSWHVLKASNRVDFTDLTPGRYRLSVAGFSDEKPMDNVSSLDIYIKPVWWQSTAAKSGMAVLLLALAVWLLLLFLSSAKHRQELETARLDMEKSRKVEIDLGGIDVPTDNSDEQLIRKISSVILENISNSEFDVESLCLQIGMSKASLYRKLKAITGESTNEFIQNFRLKYAARLLSDTDRPVSDIAYDVGFSDPYYFSRAFKKLFGLSPKQWRQSQKNGAAENAGTTCL